MSGTIAPYDVQVSDLRESADAAASGRSHLLAAAIFLVVVAVACALQALGAPTAAPERTSYTACLRADGSLYGLAEGPGPALQCGPNETVVQATLARDGDGIGHGEER